MNLGHPQAGECRTYGASGPFFQATQRLRAGLTFAAPTVLVGLARRKGDSKTQVQTTNLGHPQAGECRTYGASGFFLKLPSACALG